jgi:hypothetical protein
MNRSDVVFQTTDLAVNVFDHHGVTVKVLALAASLLAASLQGQAAPHVATSLPPAERIALEAIRKQVWVDWFTGDTAALHRVLAPELVTLGPGGQQSLMQSLAGSARFKASGARLVSVTFDSTSHHRFGDVVVMFSKYDVVTEKDGKRSTQAGHATEVFVRSGGKWVHTSWHLDVK